MQRLETELSWSKNIINELCVPWLRSSGVLQVQTDDKLIAKILDHCREVMDNQAQLENIDISEIFIGANINEDGILSIFAATEEDLKILREKARK